ncbi:MAG TPA: SLC13 family permease [Candidatus Izemoplasmatales bacterium]|nr:SLC13 family permease [Bacillota bacterium]HRY78159.1 SLC13 family permease [Candidatus Izemoplasmatales bacterium]
MIKKILKYFWKDKVFVIAFALAILSCFFVPPSAVYLDYVNWKVPIIMFTLMLAVAGMYEANLFSFISIKLVSRFYSIKWIGLVVILASFFLGMWITNDAVLLTLVPFTLVVTKQTGQERYALIIVIMQTIAANMGSALTPMGDPQNIYLYAHYELGFGEFVAAMAPITITGFVLLVVSTVLLIPNVPCQPIMVAPKVAFRKLWVYGLIFINALLCVLKVLPPWWTFGITVVLIVPFGIHLLKKVDYTLILTFISFFVFTGNLSQMTSVVSFVSEWLNTDVSVYFSGLVVSQFISNVPASILLSTFTPKLFWRPLLQGVNVGAMGTLLASLASLIALKFVIKDFPNQGKTYIKTYSLLCVVYIAIITAVVFIINYL